ncbi:MAG: sigma-70 family RNA polymerase sigma factor [Desulfobacterota bacterium]|nr:sigma-70 family RNA polymerase sigma factor [Thermodesulfobacteriota bacterium]
MDEKEAELIKRCQQGDQTAMREIFEQHHRRVYRIAYGVVRRREDALDVVQEVFIKLFRSLKGFKGKSTLSTYLYRLTLNAAIDHCRRSKKTPGVSLEATGDIRAVEAEEGRPDQLAARKELEAIMKWAIDQLPREQRSALLLREIEELSYAEIAETMGCSIGTVMSRLHYGRKRLLELLKDHLKGEGNR